MKKFIKKMKIILILFSLFCIYQVSSNCSNNYQLKSWFGNIFSTPFRAKINGDNLYVIDTGRRWVINISMSNHDQYSIIIGERGNNFETPSSLCFDNQNNLYILDTSKKEIQKFDAIGNFLSKFGEEGKGNGKFEDPVSMAIDTLNNNLFVGDAKSRDIQVFTLDGTFVRRLDTSDQFDTPFDMNTDSFGEIYVLDPNLKNIKKVNKTSGEILGVWGGEEGEDNGEFQDPVGFSFDKEDNFLIVDQTRNDVQIISKNNGQFLGKFGKEGEDDGDFILPTGVFCYQRDGEQQVLVVDSQAQNVQFFSYQGNFLDKIYSDGNIDGNFLFPFSILASENYLYVVDQVRKDIQAFNYNGQFEFKFDGSTNNDKKNKRIQVEIENPMDLASDSEKNLYLVDSELAEVLKFDENGDLLETIGEFGTEDGDFYNPISVAVDTQDNLLVADEGKLEIQKFNSSGEFLLKFGSFGVADGQFKSLRSIASDSLDNVYASDLQLFYIQKFSPKGEFLCKWDIGQNESYSLNKPDTPISLSMDAYDDLFVIESYKNLIKKFSNNGELLAQLSISNPLSISASTSFSFNNTCSLFILSENAIMRYESESIEPSPPPSSKPCQSDLDCDFPEVCLITKFNSKISETRECAKIVSCFSKNNAIQIQCSNDGKGFISSLLPSSIPSQQKKRRLFESSQKKFTEKKRFHPKNTKKSKAQRNLGGQDVRSSFVQLKKLILKQIKSDNKKFKDNLKKNLKRAANQPYFSPLNTYHLLAHKMIKKIKHNNFYYHSPTSQSGKKRSFVAPKNNIVKQKSNYTTCETKNQSLLFYLTSNSTIISQFQHFSSFHGLKIIFNPPSLHSSLPLMELKEGASLFGNVLLEINHLPSNEIFDVFLLKCHKECLGNFSSIDLLYLGDSRPCEEIKLEPRFNSSEYWVVISFDSQKCSRSARNIMIIELSLGSIALFLCYCFYSYYSKKFNSIKHQRMLNEGSQILQDSLIIDEINKTNNN